MERELGKGETLSKHRKDLLCFAKAKKLTIVKIYEELVTGESLLYRPAMLDLLKDVQSGLYDAVLVMDLQRLGRGDMEEQGIILKAFKNTDTKIITPDKEYDLSNEFDEEYSEFEAFMSRKEYKMINKRLQRGVLHSVKSGNYNSAFPPFGYLIKEEKLGRTLEPHPDQADILKGIFDWYINESFGSQIIADRLNGMGVKTNRNNKWTSHAVSAIIKNPVYTGRISWCKTLSYRTAKKKGASRLQPKENWIISDGKHPALITDEVYERAQNIMKSHIKNHTKPSAQLCNPLAGLVVCGVCGSKMRYRTYLKSEPHLICINKCGNKSSKHSYVEKRVIAALEEYLDEYYFDVSAKADVSTSNEFALKSSISLLEKQLKEAFLQKGNIHDLLEKGVYSIDLFTQRSSVISAKIQELQKAIAETTAIYQKALKQSSHEIDLLPRVTKIINEYSTLKSADDKNLLLKSVLEKVEYLKYKDCRDDNFDIKLYPLF